MSLVAASQQVVAQANFLGFGGFVESGGWEYEGWHFQKMNSENRRVGPNEVAKAADIVGYWGKGGSVTVPDELDGLPVAEVSLKPKARVAGVDRESPEPVTELIIPGSIHKIQGITLPDLTNVIIEDGVNVIIDKAFVGSTNLRSVSIPGSITNFGSQAFHKLPYLTNVVFGEGLTEIPSMAFAHSAITSAIMPRGVTVIETAAFYGCTNLTDVVIPGTVRLVGNNAFWGCSNLTRLVIEEGVQDIQNSAFRECVKLASVVLPESFKGIPSDQFRDCPSLTNITLPRHVMDFLSIEGFGLSEPVEAELLKRSKAAGLYWSDCKKSAE